MTRDEAVKEAEKLIKFIKSRPKTSVGDRTVEALETLIALALGVG